MQLLNRFQKCPHNGPALPPRARAVHPSIPFTPRPPVLKKKKKKKKQTRPSFPPPPPIYYHCSAQRTCDGSCRTLGIEGPKNKTCTTRTMDSTRCNPSLKKREKKKYRIGINNHIASSNPPPKSNKYKKKKKKKKKPSRASPQAHDLHAFNPAAATVPQSPHLPQSQILPQPPINGAHQT